MLNRTKLKLLPNESNILFLLVILVIINLKLVYYPTRDVGNSGECPNLMVAPPSVVLFDDDRTTQDISRIAGRDPGNYKSEPPPHSSHPTTVTRQDEERNPGRPEISF